MPLINRFEEDFLEEFSELNLDNVNNYMRENNKAIIFLCGFSESINEKIEKILGKFIIKKVRENYYPRLLRGCDSESLEHPEYLVYALQENRFSSDELRKINLETDSWRIAFISKYSEKNLLKNAREKLLRPLE